MLNVAMKFIMLSVITLNVAILSFSALPHVLSLNKACSGSIKSPRPLLSVAIVTGNGRVGEDESDGAGVDGRQRERDGGGAGSARYDDFTFLKVQYD
jgi:hypothetical protein